MLGRGQVCPIALMAMPSRHVSIVQLFTSGLRGYLSLKSEFLSDECQPGVIDGCISDGCATGYIGGFAGGAFL